MLLVDASEGRFDLASSEKVLVVLVANGEAVVDDAVVLSSFFVGLPDLNQAWQCQLNKSG